VPNRRDLALAARRARERAADAVAEWRRLADPEVFVEVQLAPLDAAAIEGLA